MITVKQSPLPGGLCPHMRGDGNVSRNFDARSVRIEAFVFARMHKSPQGPLQAGNTKIKDLSNNLGRFLGPDCEVVVHDFTNGLEHTIVHIVNGHVSGREVGGCPTNLFFENVNSICDKKEEYAEYYTTTEDGRTIRSSTTLIKDEEGQLVGAMCININITGLLSARSMLNSVIGKGAQEDAGTETEKFARNVQELMKHFFSEVEREVGKPASEMNRQEKMRALAYLDSRGVFQIAKAHVHLCKFFGISKFTLYNYLDEVRKSGSSE